jgi:hypothetical protein
MKRQKTNERVAPHYINPKPERTKELGDYIKSITGT